MLRDGNAPTGAQTAVRTAHRPGSDAAARGHTAQQPQQQPQRPPQRPPRVLEALYGGGGAVRSLGDGLVAAAAAVGCGPQLATALR
jgi:hypothetical protein